MGIDQHPGDCYDAPVTGPETMHGTIRTLGIVPFFVNAIPGFSIEEMTPKSLWFSDEDLGPWDWKIPVVQQGDIAYGKFLAGGKSSFATIPWYRELMNYRRASPKWQPTGLAAAARDLLGQTGTTTIREVRQALGVRKNVADAAMTRLQMGTWAVIGDFQRVYRGADLHYSGWQVASFCRPEDLFEDEGTAVRHSPAESLGRLLAHLHAIAPQASERQLRALLD